MSRSDHRPHTPASTSTPPTPTAISSTSSLPPPFSTTSMPRLQALYSDFARQKHSNPESYHANVDWWRRALEVVVSAGMQQPVHLHLPQTATPRRRGRGVEDVDEVGDGLVSNAILNTNSDRLVLHAGRELIERVKLPKAGKPLALGAVLSELLSTRSAIPLSTFLSAKASIYDPGWLPARIAAYVVGRPLWWALEQMGVVGEEGLFGSSGNRSGSSSSRGAGGGRGGGKDTGWWGAYVLVALVEKAADEVEALQDERQGSAGDALYTMDSFRQVFKGIFAGAGGEEDEALPPTRETDAKVLLKFLERDRGVLVVDKDVIKFVDKHASAEERTITAVDSGILELKRALENLQTQVDSLQRKIDDCTRKASAALQQKRKPAALSYLRSRKQFEDLLNKRLGSLHTLQATFITVEAAAGDVEIMKSYESSTATLRTILAHPALARASIDGTMEALAEATADAREVDEAVRIGGEVALGVGEGVDEDELERELAVMVREAEAEAQEKEKEERTKRRLEEVQETPGGVPGVDKEVPEARAPVPASS